MIKDSLGKPYGIQGVQQFNSGVTLDDAAGQTALNYYQQDDTTLAAVTFRGNLGGSNSSAIAIKITRVGRIVTLVIPDLKTIVPTTNSTALISNTALPTWARPASASLGAHIVVNDNGGSVNNVLGSIAIGSDGIISVYRSNVATPFTNSAQAGWEWILNISYTI